jgi:enolase
MEGLTRCANRVPRVHDFPAKGNLFTHAMQMELRFSQILKVLHDRGLSTAVGDEGGFNSYLQPSGWRHIDTIKNAVLKLPALETR